MCQKGPMLQCICVHLFKFTKISFFYSTTTTLHNLPSTPSIIAQKKWCAAQKLQSYLGKRYSNIINPMQKNSLCIKSSVVDIMNAVLWTPVDSSGNPSGYYPHESEDGEPGTSSANEGSCHSRNLQGAAAIVEKGTYQMMDMMWTTKAGTGTTQMWGW